LQISELCPYDMQSEHDGGRWTKSSSSGLWRRVALW
jgi:hypothetical protein